MRHAGEVAGDLAGEGDDVEFAALHRDVRVEVICQRIVFVGAVLRAADDGCTVGGGGIVAEVRADNALSYRDGVELGDKDGAVILDRFGAETAEGDVLKRGRSVLHIALAIAEKTGTIRRAVGRAADLLRQRDETRVRRLDQVTV